MSHRNSKSKRGVGVRSRLNGRQLAGAAVVLACAAPAALAVDNLWTGAVSSDWNTPGNWSLGRVPVNPNGQPAPDDFDDAAINSSTPTVPNNPIISANIAATPRDIIVASGAGANGVLVHNAGTAATGAPNWMFVGRDGGTGRYDLLGSGSTNVGNRLYVAGHFGAPATGTVNVNTTGTLAMGGDLNLGAAGGTGTLNLDAGTVNVGAWLSVGRDENGFGGTGNVNQSGGTLNVSGVTVLGLPGTTGNLTMTGGTHNVGGEFWVGNGVGGGTPSTGVANINGGAVTVNNWIAVGRDGARGTLNVGGTAVVRELGDLNNHITIGTGAGGTGIVNVSGGGTLSTNADFILGENNATATGTVNQTGGTVIVGRNLEVQRAGIGTYNLTGGTLVVNGNIDAQDGTFAFTGGRITREGPGVVTYNGNLTTGGKPAILALGNDKTVDVNGVLNVVAGNSFDLSGRVISYDGSGIDTGSIPLGTVDSILGTFGPLTTDVIGLNSGGASFISEAEGEGGLFNPNTQSVFWIQEAGGNVTLQFSVVPEPGAIAVLGLSSLALLGRRRKS